MDNKIIYEYQDWTKLDKETLNPKINKLYNTIPKSVKSIIDIGCGNGVITNELAKKYKIIGVDRSEAALKHVKCDSIQCSSDSIPIPDSSFDLVFSSELLEHLEDDKYSGTIKEMKRLSRQFILITVPNSENPDKLSIKCPSCGYVYNRPNHLRSFHLSDFQRDFPEYKILENFTCGKKVRYSNPQLLTFKLRYSPSTSWIPYYWIDRQNRNTICPSCENHFSFPYIFHPISFLCDVLNVTVSPKKPYWLFILLEKQY